MKKIILAGGTGFLGSCVIKHFINQNVELVVLTRNTLRDHDNVHYEQWDGKNFGPWTSTLEGADAIINFNGKSVDCRYTRKNMELIYSSRLDATAAIGKALLCCKLPPKVWINAASSTIYRHSLDKEMDEITGEIGDGFSIDVCLKWEKMFNKFVLPATRKVLIRTAIVLGKDGGALHPLKMLAKAGMGGRQGNGNQFISWIHEDDFVGIIDYIIKNEQVTGVYNVTSPHPVTNKDFMRTLRDVTGIPIGIPIPELILKIGAVIIRTEPELVLKSRRVVPARLISEGYKFEYDNLRDALRQLVS